MVIMVFLKLCKLEKLRSNCGFYKRGYFIKSTTFIKHNSKILPAAHKAKNVAQCVFKFLAKTIEGELLTCFESVS